MRPSGWLALACLLMSACAGPDESVADGERTIPEDALYIVSPDEPGAPTLGSVRLLAWGPDREILAFDQFSQRIEVYDSLGWVRSIGGPGVGPAEFSPMVQALVPLPEGVAVLDLGNGRLSVIDYSGGEVEQHRLEVSDTGLPVHAAASPSDQLLVQFRGSAEEDADSIRILWPATDRDVVAAVPSGSSVTMSGGGSPVYKMLAPEVYWAPADDGVYVVNSHEYLVSRDAGGVSVTVFALPHDPEPVSSGDIAAVRERIAEELRRNGLDEAQVGSFLETVEFHDVLPVVAWLTVSRDGDIWIQRGGSPAALAEERGLPDLRLNHGSPVWDRWAPEGVLLETVRFPPRFMPMEFGEDAVLGVLFDALGQERVARAPL